MNDTTTITSSSSSLIIYNVFRNKYIVQLIGKEIHHINYINNNGVSYRFNEIPSLKWVVENDTGDLIHQLCKRSLITNQIGLSTLQVGWATLDMIIAVCSPHKYHKSITFNIDTFDTIFKYYQTAFEQEHCAVDSAASSGNIELVRYLLNHGTPFTTNAIDSACEAGYLEIVKLLVETNPANDPTIFDDNVKFTNHAYDRAATNGHLDVLLYLDQLKEQYDKGMSKYRVEFTVRAIDGAVKNNHSNIVDHILEKYRKDSTMKGYLFSKEALQWCIGNGNTDLLQKLWNFPHSDKNLQVGGLWCMSGLSLASSKGYFSMVKWIFENGILEYVPDMALTSAIEHNHREIFDYYLEMYHKSPKFSLYRRNFSLSYALNHAAIHKQFELFKLLFKTTRDNNEMMDIPMIVKLACNNDSIDIIIWLMNNLTVIPLPISEVLHAASAGHLEIVKYLVKEKGAVILADHIEECAQSSNVECMEYLLSEFGNRGRITKRTVLSACRGGNLKMVELLLTRLVDWQDNRRECLVECFDACVHSGSLECLKLIEDSLSKKAYIDSGRATVVTKSINVAIQNGYTHIIKHLFVKYPYLLDMESDPADSYLLINNGLQEAIKLGYCDTVELILDIKALYKITTTEASDQDGGKVDWVESNEYRYEINPKVYQASIDAGSPIMVELFHRYRPQLISTNPSVILSFGYIDMYHKLLRWNKENGSDPSPSNLNYEWYFNLIRKGNIDMIRYITKEKNIISAPSPSLPSLQIGVTPKYCHIGTINFMQTSARHHIANYSVLYLSLICIKGDNYSAFKACEGEANGYHYFSDYHISAAHVSNMSILRLLTKRSTKKVKFSKHHNNSDGFNYTVLNFMKKNW